MIFDLICAITILGLALKGFKEIFFNRLALIAALIIAFSISSFLVPLYTNYIKIPLNLPSNISSFIITFILTYLLLTLPGFFLKVILGGVFLILFYAILTNFIPMEYRKVILSNSYVYSIIEPGMFYINSIFKFFKIVR